MSATHQDIKAARQELRLRQEESRELGLDNLSPKTFESTAEEIRVLSEETLPALEEEYRGTSGPAPTAGVNL
jgi:hypothetical protein